MACPAGAGCRPLGEEEAPACRRFAPLARANASRAAVAGLDEGAGREIRGLPAGLLPRRCFNALQEYICSRALGGCAHSAALPLCQSVCQNVRDSCSWAIRMMMPSQARRELECHRYTAGSWPACTQPRSHELDACASSLAQAGPCGGGSAALLEAPCGACRRDEWPPRFDPLPLDACGLCNGDNTSCVGCDGANAAFDACAVCGGRADICQALDADPKLLGYVASAGLALGLLLALAALLLRRRNVLQCVGVREAAPGLARSAAWASAQSRVFGHLGRGVAARARGVIVAAAFLAVLAGCGLIGMHTQKDPLALWLPARSPAALSAERWQAIVGLPRPRHALVLMAATSGSAVPVREGLQQALALHEQMLRLQVSGHGLLGSDGNSSSGLLHARDGVISPLALWDHDAQTLAADPTPGRTLAAALSAQTGPEAFLGKVYSGQVAFEVEPAEGGGGGDGSLRAVQLLYVLDGSPERKDQVAAWERAAAEFLFGEEAPSTTWPLWRPHFSSEQLLADELSGAISGDVSLIVLSYCLMCIYTSAFLGNHQDFLRGRGAVASAAVVSVGLATLAAFGICGAAGVVYNETVNIALFVLVGVGVDDAFVIVRALEDVSERGACGEAEPLDDADVEGRIGQALGECGPAILLSSATNALAFGLGSATPLPALHSFCIYASVGMVTDFVFQTTFFVAILALDERRRLAGRCSVLPCLPATAMVSEAAAPASGALAAARRRAAAWRRAAAGWLTASGPVRCGVLLVFLASSSFSIWAAYTMPVGLQATDLVPKGSRSAAFFARAEALLPGARRLAEVVVQHGPLEGRPSDASVDLLDDTTRLGLRRLRGALEATAFLGASGAVGPLWLDALAERQRLLGRPPVGAPGGELLRGALADFAASPEGRVLEEQAALRTVNGAVLATRLRVLAEGYGARRMVALRATVAAAGLGGAAFVHSPADIYYEQDAIMLEYTFQNLLWVMLAVLTAVLLVSASPSFVAVMAFCILSCCTHMFGWMALTGTPLNALSLIPLLLAVGLCVDYCAHVVHAFWGEQGTSPKRAACALRLRGVAVAHGGLSTALSQVLLAFSESLIFTIFFKMMCGVVVVGLLHALVLLPACLSLLPGAGEQEHERLGRGAQDNSPDTAWAGSPPADTIGCHSERTS